MSRMTPEAKTVKIPVYIENSQIIPADPTLKLKENSSGELTMLASAVVDISKRNELLTHTDIEVLSADTMLLVAMKPGSGFDNYLPEDIDKILSPELLSFMYTPHQRGEHVSKDTEEGIFIPIILLEPLKMELRGGSKEAKLKFCHCVIPALNREAHSPNHAYTLLSQRYEPRRMSHTGNAFTKIYYLNKDKRTWEPIETLRYDQECRK